MIWGCNTRAPTSLQIKRLEVFHRHCIHRILDTIMQQQVKEQHEIKNEFIVLEKLNLKPAETYLSRIRQELCFLTRITCMDPSFLPRQAINSQVNANGTCSRNVVKKEE
jgi:hypothetical protein